ncbi:AAA family ATPase [Actinomadura terrae]|uniref:AAA family ATPase n=1 Tax=Actinomadura terrae TaxID=604353 RepID=UPI001FA731A9|nr:AAA family ATPase [Actinomadura terrae]
MLNEGRIIVLDGHDGCGKSTLARQVARLTGGSVVKPFGDTLGDHIAWLWGNRRFAAADELARSSIERVLQREPGTLVFDRHWATMFTVLPEHFWSNWGEPPRTVLCTASVETVVRRLTERGEDPGDRDEHAHYLTQYLKVIERCPRSLVLETDRVGLDGCVAAISGFLEENREDLPGRDDPARTS